MKKFISTAIIICIFSSCLFSSCFSQDENIIDVSFEIITGSGFVDYYVGDFFYYNISLMNSGNTSISATFKVEVFNSTYEQMGAIRYYSLELQSGETEFLFPNITRTDKDDVFSVYLMETPGTYYVELSSETPITYFRYFENEGYYFDDNKIRATFNVMASYEKTQNERWNEFLTKNEEYMQEVERYIQESRNESIETRNLSLVSLFVATISVLISIISTLWIIDEEKRQNRTLLYVLTIGFMIISLGFLLWMFLLIF